MDKQMQLGAVLLGGYLLGRTKKGGMASRLALRMAMSGQDVQPGELVQQNATKLLQSDLVAQLREQMMEVAKAAFDARVASLAQNLTDRTQALQASTDQVTDTTQKATDAVSGLTGDDEEDSDGPEDEAEEPDQDGEEPDDEADEPEEEADDEEDEPDDEEEDSDLQERVKTLKAKRVTTLRRMARDLFDEEDDDQIDKASKDDLAVWIAEAEAEDAENDNDDEESN
jgi:hypothetical protein